MKYEGCRELYELSGNTGSLRYMAPEVARSEPYNLTADVYSFGLLLWQTCSLQLPYDGMNRQDHSELVVHGNERPLLDSNWSTPLRILMKRAWEPDPLVRPSMDSIYKILKREICALRDVTSPVWNTPVVVPHLFSTGLLQRIAAAGDQETLVLSPSASPSPPLHRL